jgi:hypothetical protein
MAPITRPVTLPTAPTPENIERALDCAAGSGNMCTINDMADGIVSEATANKTDQFRVTMKSEPKLTYPRHGAHDDDSNLVSQKASY